MNLHIPAFAVLGHPNEGKSSVVSTLAEDDTVPISPVPGATRECREYPVVVDGREILRFIDTPGFQQPRKTLEWMKQYGGPAEQMIFQFIHEKKSDPDFAHECQLFAPLAAGAGIIYVADGSRPFRSVDGIEMEILRMTGLPRMAVINPKESGPGDFLDQWRLQARKHFNTIRVFDAQNASYAERIALLESLQSIDPLWQPHLRQVIEAFKKDWDQRIHDTAGIILDLIEHAAGHRVRKMCPDDSQKEIAKKELMEQYQKDIAAIEKSAHKHIRKRFKHNIFHFELPAYSILHEDMFSKKSWRILGLKKWQLTVAGGASGGMVGAKIDLAAGGHSFALGALIGAGIGACAAALGGKHVAAAKVKGLPLGRMDIQVGPGRNHQMMYVLVDRALIYFSHVINWAHSRRDHAENLKPSHMEKKIGFISSMENADKLVFAKFFRAVQKGQHLKIEVLKPGVIGILVKTLHQISIAAHPVE